MADVTLKNACYIALSNLNLVVKKCDYILHKKRSKNQRFRSTPVLCNNFLSLGLKEKYRVVITSLYIGGTTITVWVTLNNPLSQKVLLNFLKYDRPIGLRDGNFTVLLQNVFFNQKFRVSFYPKDEFQARYYYFALEKAIYLPK